MTASEPVPYLADTERAGFGAAVASAEPRTGNSAQPSRPTAGTTDGKAADRQASRQSPPENANATANDADARRQAADQQAADRQAAERRRAERHRRWAERHRRDQRDQRDADEQNSRQPTDRGDFGYGKRDDSDSRDLAWRPAYRPPQFPLFGGDDD